MNLVRRLIENTVAGDVPMMMAAPLAVRRRQTKDEKPKPATLLRRKGGLVQKLVKEDSSIIPDDAEEITAVGTNSPKPEAVDKSPVADSNRLGLLEPALALVAPDITPNAKTEIDPGLVPQRTAPVMDLLMGRANASQPEPAQSAPLKIESGPNVNGLLGITENVGSGEAAGLPTGDMPKPVSGDTKKMTESFRRFHRVNK